MSSFRQAIEAAAVGEPVFPEPGTVARAYRFGPDFIGFAGHFPGFPILPAVLQIQTALCLLESMEGPGLALLAIENAKFHIQLGPRQEIEVSCRRKEGARRHHEARLTLDGKLASSFLLFTGPAGGPP